MLLKFVNATTPALAATVPTLVATPTLAETAPILAATPSCGRKTDVQRKYRDKPLE